MALGINTNVASLNAQNALSKSQGQNDQALQRLSSGLRINSAKDDAAGLAISTRFESQISGLDVASRNANDGISLAQTAEGALDEITNNLQRVRELAVQSANATNSTSDRAALDQEVQQRIEEIDRIASQTSFNGLNVLEGNLGDQLFQVGANVGETITVGLDDGARSSQLGALADADLDFSGEAGTITVAVGDNTADVEIAADESAVSIANSITEVAGVTSVEASNVQELDFGTISSDGGDTAELTFTFQVGDGTAQTVNVSVANGENLTAAELQTAIEDEGLTGFSVSEDATGVLTFTTDDGENLSVTQTLDNGSIADALGDGSTGFTTADIADPLVGQVNVQASEDITITNDDTNATVASVDGDALAADAETTVEATGSLDDVNVLTVAASNEAIVRLDNALTSVNNIRSELGAVQNRFESTIANLASTSENLSAANSRIRDADFAAETAALSQSQVLQQAGISVLAQANARPQQVLALLQ